MDIKVKPLDRKLSDYEEIPKSGKKYFLLGNGNFGYAEKMRSKIDNKFYAIKKINPSNFNKKRFKTDFTREIINMKDLNHENCIKFYGYFKDKEKIDKYKEIFTKIYTKNNKIKELELLKKETEDKEVYCLVMEFAQKGSLEDNYNEYKKQFPDKRHFKPLNQKEIITYFKQILNGLKYLHKRGIIHRDIKPDNILLAKNNCFKISDFGISALFRDDNLYNQDIDDILFCNNTRQGRIDFVCPEMEEGNAYDYGADIYSLGLTMLFLMSYEKPNVVKKGSSKKNIDFFSMSPIYNIYLRRLVIKMLNDDKNERPSASDILDELQIIELFIDNPKNKILKKVLRELNISGNKENQNPQNYPMINQEILEKEKRFEYEDIYPQIKEKNKIKVKLIFPFYTYYIQIPSDLRKDELYGTVNYIYNREIDFPSNDIIEMIELFHNGIELDNDDTSIKCISSFDSIIVKFSQSEIELYEDSLLLKKKNIINVEIQSDLFFFRRNIPLEQNMTFENMMKAFCIYNYINLPYIGDITLLYNCKKLEYKKTLFASQIEDGSILSIYDWYLPKPDDFSNRYSIFKNPGKHLHVYVEDKINNSKFKFHAGSLQKIKDFYAYLNIKYKENLIITVGEKELKKDDENTFTSLGIRNDFECIINEMKKDLQ